MRSLLVLSCALLFSTSWAWFYGRPMPDLMSHGEVWPLPQQQTFPGQNFSHFLDPVNFKFTAAVGSASNILQKAFARYKLWTFIDYPKNPNVPSKTFTLTELIVTVDNNNDVDNQYPQLGMNENYTLTVTSAAVATLHANEIWGALRGLETFSQLVWQPESNVYQLEARTIVDWPRFPHRGAHLDTSRHFVTINVLKRHLDLMSQNKMNVLHFHVVDSEAFPYPSKIFPDLSAKGGYTPNHVYTIEQIKDLIDYARNRAIRVIPEFDTPGHTGAWEPGWPGFLSECYDALGNTDVVTKNIIDPSKEENYERLRIFLEEALALFKDNYIHLGGDEVSENMLQCWYRNKEVRAWMKTAGFGDDTYAVLNDYFRRLFAFVQNGRNGSSVPQVVVWQEVLDNKVEAPQAIAHIWKGDNYEDIMLEVASVTEHGHFAILSSCWYLNYIKYGPDWGYLESANLRLRGLYYQCDPQDFKGTQEQKDRVLGGEAAMWGEFVDSTNSVDRFWPRASAPAERLWSNKDQTQSADAAWPRLHEHRCRMLRRGFRVQTPNNPDFCPTYWNPDYPDLLDDPIVP